MAHSDTASDRARVDQRLSELAYARRERLTQTIAELVQIPSENTPPVGSEAECQRYVFDRLNSMDLKAELYPLMNVAGIGDHPEFWPGRDYTNRPNVAAVWAGSGGGRSLLLSATLTQCREVRNPGADPRSARLSKAIVSMDSARTT